jgi:hypothetical protein
MGGDELDSVDLQLGPAEPVSGDDFSVKIDGEVVAQDHPIRRRVADVLARQRDKDPFAAVARDTTPLRESGAGPDSVELEVLGRLARRTSGRWRMQSVRRSKTSWAMGWSLG